MLTGRPLYDANEILAFLLEIVSLGLLAWWGFTREGPVLLRVLLGVGAPLVGAVFWGLLAAPKARFRLPMPAVLGVKTVFFLAVTLALAAVCGTTAAVVLAVVVAANLTVATALR
ncbi:hypothetical protein GCM10022221_30370 [Actinocorallia aurea]